jgi:hypothetical protein
MNIDTQTKYDINDIVTSLNSQVIDIVEDKEPKESFFEILKNKKISLETDELEKKVALSGNPLPPSWDSNISISTDTPAISIDEIEALLNSSNLELIGTEKLPENTQASDIHKQVSYNLALRFINQYISQDEAPSKVDPAIKESILGNYNISKDLPVKFGSETQELNPDHKSHKITVRNLTQNRKVILGEINQFYDADTNEKKLDLLTELNLLKEIDDENNSEKEKKSHITLKTPFLKGDDIINQNSITSGFSLNEIGKDGNQIKTKSNLFSNLQGINLEESVALNQRPEYDTEKAAFSQMMRAGAFGKNGINLKNNNQEVDQVNGVINDGETIQKSIENIDVLSKEEYLGAKPYLEKNLNAKLGDRQNIEKAQVIAIDYLEKIDTEKTSSVREVNIESVKNNYNNLISNNIINDAHIAQTGFNETRYLEIDLSNHKIDGNISESQNHQINRDIYEKLSGHLGLEVTNLVQKKVDGRYKITMSLYPEDLGTIEMDVEYSAKQGIHINLVGENGRVSQIFQENLYLLKQSFQNNSGLELDITLGHRSDESANENGKKSRNNAAELSDTREQDMLVEEKSRIITAKSNRIDKLV